MQEKHKEKEEKQNNNKEENETTYNQNFKLLDFPYQHEVIDTIATIIKKKRREVLKSMG